MKSFMKKATNCVENDFSLPPPDGADSIWSGQLEADDEQIITVPSTSAGGNSNYSVNQYAAIFKPQFGSTIWYAVNATAVVPTTTGSFDVIDMVDEECRTFNAGDEIHVITGDDTAFLAVSFYQI